MEFRFRAMRLAHDPNNLDTTVNLASPRSWIALWVTFFLVVGAVVWGFVGTIPQSVSGSGVLTLPDGVVRMQAGVTGTVTSLDVGPQQPVTAGERLGTVTDSGGAVHQLVAPFAGTVVLADYPAGSAVSPTDEVVVLERAAGENALQASIVVPQTAATRLHPGLAVTMSVDVVPASEFGMLRGVVQSVSPYPITDRGLSFLVLDRPTAGRLLAGGAMSLVTIALVPDGSTASGYAWTSVSGPPFGLHFQDQVSATVALPDRSPVSYVLGGP